MCSLENCVYEVTRVVRFIETEGRMVVARAWEEGEMGSYYLMDAVSIWKDEIKFWRWMVVIAAQWYKYTKTTELHTLNWKKWWILSYIFYNLKKKKPKLRMCNSTTALDNNVVVPQNIKHRVTMCPGIPLLGIHPSEMKANIHTKTCTWMLMGIWS